MLLWMGALTGYDIAARRLPNWLTLPGAAVIVAAAVVADRGVPALAGGSALAAVYLVVHLTSPSAMGGGDVKLALALGALTGRFGVEVWLLAALGAPLVTAATGMVGLLWGVRTVPHGPAMCLASLAAVSLAIF